MTTTSKSKTHAPTTTKRATTARKSPVAKAAPVKADPASSKSVTPVVVQSEAPAVSGPEMKKRDLINMVVERSGVKKRDAKPAVEAALAILGDALAEGRDLNLAPLGKIKVTKQKKIPQGTVLTARVRRNNEAKPDAAPDPLAQAAE